MRIQSTDRRERLYGNLAEATGESTKSGAIDAAAEYYLAMAGGTTAHPNGAVEELMEKATARGSLTAREIAEILSQEQLPIGYEELYSVGGPE